MLRALCVASLLVATAGQAQTRRDPLRGLENYVNAAMRQWQVPGVAIAIVRGDSVIYARGFGVRELGRPERVDEHTLFAVASNTKAVTATALGLLVSENTLRWDDRARQHLPRFALDDSLASRDVTVRDLLSHRIGLGTWAGDLLWYGSDLPIDSVMAGTARVPLTLGFRYRYGYSNLGFIAAGQMIPVLSGQSWADFVRARLLEPLGMSRTTTSVADLPARGNVASPHAMIDGRIQPVPYRPVDNAAPAAALNSSASEWAHWLSLNLGWGSYRGRRIVDSAVIAETRIPNTALRNRPNRLFPNFNLQSYGLGWFIRDFRGRLEITHDGGMDGMYSKSGFLPSENIGVVVLTNKDEHDLQTGLYYHILDLMLGPTGHDYSATLLAAQEQPAPQAPRRDSRPGLPLADYAGRYVNPTLGELTIAIDSATRRITVRLPHHPGLRANLAHWEDNVFVARWEDRYFRESRLTFEVMGDRAVSVRFTVRPDFIDPLEYTFRR